MCTRSTIHIKEGRRTILSIYNQYDGYLEGVGKDLAEFLRNGHPRKQFETSKHLDFNGIHCLAAQLVTAFKKGVGNCYITDAKDRQEYNYFISLEGNAFRCIPYQLKIRVTDEENNVLFSGDLNEFCNVTKLEECNKVVAIKR